jgi:Protein of unknown function (DUF2793)
MSIVNGPKIVTMVSAANGDTYGDGDRHQLRTQQALIQANVKNLTLATPPGSPSNGDTYVVAASPTGLWAGQANAIAYWAVDNQDGPSITPNIATGAWEFYTPLAGWQVWDTNTSASWRFNGTAWVLASALKVPVVAAATTTINPALGSSFRVAVGTAVTSVVFSAGVSDGQTIEVMWVQSTGFAVSGFAGNIHGVGFLTAGSNVFTGVPSPAASSVSVQRYTWDLATTTWYAVATGVAGM